jgi:hypothetical protein
MKYRLGPGSKGKELRKRRRRNQSELLEILSLTFHICPSTTTSRAVTMPRMHAYIKESKKRS